MHWFCKLLLLWVCFFSLSPIYSESLQYPGTDKETYAIKFIDKLYRKLNAIAKSDLSVRMAIISEYFIGTKYLLGALGEGMAGHFDQAPKYRVDAFDCETYVTTVLALALANNSEQFKTCLNKIRYAQGKVTYLTRNHFTSVDWNTYNQQQGFLKDITPALTDAKHHTVARFTNTIINKANWYQHLTLQNIRLYNATQQTQFIRLTELKKLGSKLGETNSQIPYIPLDVLFDSHKIPNKYLFSQIPNAAIIEIVRPNWPLKNSIGTNLDISHIGLTFWKNNILFFREASSIYGQVIDVPLIDYLKQALNSPTIKGINIQVILPTKVSSSGCA